MALTTTELLAGINAAFEDATSWNRAMARLAITDDLAEAEGRLTQAEAISASRQALATATIEQLQNEVAALQAQLDALAEIPVVPTE